MSDATSRGSSHVRTADLLPPPPLARALVFGGLAALAGAAAWGLLAFYAHREHGILAWGIGALIGFAIVKGGGHGTVLAICGGALALLSIGSGKHMAFQMSVDQQVSAMVAEVDAAAHAERTKDAADWVALGPSPTPEQIRTFAADHQYDVASPAAFARDEGPLLRAFAEKPPTLEEWRVNLKSQIVQQASFVDFLKENFHPLDIVFVLLGIASAFGLVSKATIALQVAARQAARAQSEPHDGEATRG